MKLLKDKEIIEKLKRADRVAALTGAGISAESGIPTFRDEDGLWTRVNPEEMASFEAFYSNTALVSEWYKHRREIIQQVEPNSAHIALVELESLSPEFHLITQNVDGLHQKAGSQDVIELHGNITENYCIQCGRRFSSEEFDEIYESSMDSVPKCDCGGLIRPDVVWFGEDLPQDHFERAYQASLQADVFLSVGTSAYVRPASDLPRYAKYHGALIIEVNPRETALSTQADLCLRGPAGEMLPVFVDEYKDLVRDRKLV